MVQLWAIFKLECYFCVIMKRILLIFFVLGALASCSPQAKLKRDFVGERLTEVSSKYGSPYQTIDLENGNQLLVYKKETIIRATVVDSGQHTLDPRVSPGYTKVEFFKFEVNPQGMVVKTYYDHDIER